MNAAGEKFRDINEVECIKNDTIRFKVEEYNIIQMLNYFG